jgi:hypothetical protein
MHEIGARRAKHHLRCARSAGLVHRNADTCGASAAAQTAAARSSLRMNMQCLLKTL